MPRHARGGATLFSATTKMECIMAFPPNYRQERSNRDKAKQRKAQEKQEKRDEKNAQRKTDPQPEPAASEPKKEE
jgi:hypothetical protein